MRGEALAMLLASVIGTAAMGPQWNIAAAQSSLAASHAGSPFDKDELLRRVGVYQAAIHDEQAAHQPNEKVARIYIDLGADYEDLAMFPKSESAFRSAIALLQDHPQAELAEAWGQLAVLHSIMGDLHQAEKDHMQALAVREQVGDPVGMALTWNDLADLYFRERHYDKSVEYARKSIAVLGPNSKVQPSDAIAIRQTLGYALCATHSCGEAMPILKDALAIAQKTYGADSLEAGVATYVLGYAAWQNKDIEDASRWMAQGTTRMKVDLGWGHVLYVNAVHAYAQFLREQRQFDAAATAESEVKMATSVVDARTMNTLR